MQVTAVTPVAPAILRVTYDKMPFTARPGVQYDALFLQNYRLVGPGTAELFTVRTVSGDPFSVDLVLKQKLTTGSWSVQIAAGIETPSGDTTTEQTISITISSGTKYLSATPQEVTGEDTVRSHLNPKFNTGAWPALVAGLGYSDEKLAKTAKFAYFQNFLSTASGIFLERLTNAFSVDRPPNTGLSDKALSELSIAINANRVVTTPYLDVLKAYYGKRSVAANFATASVEPYALTDGSYLNWQINGQAITTTFSQAEFTNITQATAFEVAQALNRRFVTAGIAAAAEESVDPGTGLKTVQVFSNQLGLYGSLLITGGTAQKALRFPKIIDTVSLPGVQWQVMTPTSNPGLVEYGRAWLRWTGGTDPEIFDVFEDDYVSIYDTNFTTANRGDFQILSVGVYLGKKYVEIANPDAVAQGTVTQADTDTVLFFDDSKTTLSKTSNYYATASQPWAGQVDVLLPATASSIERTEKTGWYVNGEQPLEVSNYNAFRDSSGHTVVATDTDHGLLVGDFVRLADMLPLVERDPYFSTMVNTGTDNTYNFTLRPSVKLLDGRVFVRKPSSWVIYDPETETWSETFDMMLADRTGAAAVTLNSGRVLIVGGTGGTTTSEIYDPDNNVILPAGDTDNVYPSLHAQLVKLSDGRVVAAGGTALGVAEVFEPATNLWTPMTASAAAGPFTASRIVVDGSDRVWGWRGTTVFSFNMAEDPVNTTNGYSVTTLAGGHHRTDGVLVYVPQKTGQLWYLGGYNSTPTVQSTALVFETSMRAVTATKTLSSARGYGQLVPLTPGNYLLFGGTTGTAGSMPTGGIAGPAPEILNFRALTDSLFSQSLSAELALNYERLCPVQTLDSGQVIVVSPIQPVYHILNVFQQVSSGRIDGTVKVTAVPDTDAFEFESDTQWITTWQSGNATPVAAELGEIRSGYVINPASGVTISGTNPTLTAPLFPGPAPATVAVSSVVGIANAPGYVVFDFGFDTQSPPIKILGTAGNTLRLDQSATIQVGYPIGTVATILVSTSPFAPSSTLGIGVTYVTASSVGRIAASNDIDDIKAVGVLVNKTVLYPGDTGLGNGGFPVEGAQKMSDVVYVYGGDNIAATLAAAREGDGGI